MLPIHFSVVIRKVPHLAVVVLKTVSLALSGMATGIAGLFMEAHPEPNNAPL